jgi:hypothetical protein
MTSSDRFDDEPYDVREVDDPRFVERLRQAAAEYHAPPATPREEMWAAIAEHRRQVAPVVGRPSRRWFPMAAAAGLLLATGVGLGLWLAPHETRTTVIAQNDSSRGPATRPSAPSTLAVPESAATPNEPRLSNPDASYTVATVQHLSQVETFLTSFRSDSANAQVDADLSKWGRDLLTNTRLLIDSPAAQDHLRRKLLEDLELVLVQIVQLAPNSVEQDREIIERGMRREHVMTRLRSAIPAGQTSGN